MNKNLPQFSFNCFLLMLILLMGFNTSNFAQTIPTDLTGSCATTIIDAAYSATPNTLIDYIGSKHEICQTTVTPPVNRPVTLKLNNGLTTGYVKWTVSSFTFASFNTGAFSPEVTIATNLAPTASISYSFTNVTYYVIRAYGSQTINGTYTLITGGVRYFSVIGPQAFTITPTYTTCNSVDFSIGNYHQVLLNCCDCGYDIGSLNLTINYGDVNNTQQVIYKNIMSYKSSGNITLAGLLYPSSGVYNVTVTESNDPLSDCPFVNTKTIPVYIGPPQNFAISGSNGICNGASQTLTATATTVYNPIAGYTWARDGSTISGQTTANLAITAGGTYTVTATTQSGCTATATLTVSQLTDCCNSASTITPAGCPTKTLLYASTTASQLKADLCGSTFPVTENGFNYTKLEYGTSQVAINGILTINGNYLLRNSSNITFGGSGNIVIPSGSRLIIDNSKLFACGSSMWQGITVQPGGYLETRNSTFIMDATTAVNSNNTAVIKLSNTNFYRDYVGVSVGQNTNFNAYSSINACNFQFDPNDATKNYLLAPHVGERPYVGIWATLCNNITLGDNLAVNPNIFDGLNCGIWNLWSTNMNVFNNRFSNISNYANQNYDQYGSGVCVSGGNLFNNGSYIAANTTVRTLPTAPTTSSPKTFTECLKAITVRYAPITANFNRIYGTASPNFLIRYTGIYTATCDNQPINITSNLIENIDYGINLSSNTNAATLVQQNTINVNPYTFATLGFGTPIEKSTYGISQTELSNASDCSVKLFQNTITGGLNNIVLSNTRLSRIYNNTLNLTDNVAIGNSTYTAGTFVQQSAIYAANALDYRVNENIITGNGTIFDDGYYGSSSAVSSAYRKNGIRCFSSQGEICHNFINNMGYSTQFIANCSGTKFRRNEMTNAKFGVVLTSNGTQGVIGNQGSNTMQHANLFKGTYNNTPGYRTFTINSDGNQSTFYYSPLLSPTPSPNGTNNSSYNPIKILSGGQGIDTCKDISVKSTKANSDTTYFDMLVATGAIDSLVEPELEEGSVWTSEKKLYSKLASNIGLRNSKPEFQNFFTEKQTEDIGMIREYDNVEKAVTNPYLDSVGLQTAITTALDKNATIPDATLFATNAKAVNEIYLNNQAQHKDLDRESQEMATIELLAFTCPYVAGDAVYKARAIYSVYHPEVFFDDLVICSAVGYAKKEKVINYKTPEILPYASLYPNPSNYYATVQYYIGENRAGKLSVYNPLGELLYTQKLNSGGAATIDVQEYPAGIYLVKVEDDKMKPLLQTKLMVTK